MCIFISLKKKLNKKKINIFSQIFEIRHAKMFQVFFAMAMCRIGASNIQCAIRIVVQVENVFSPHLCNSQAWPTRSSASLHPKQLSLTAGWFIQASSALRSAWWSYQLSYTVILQPILTRVSKHQSAQDHWTKFVRIIAAKSSGTLERSQVETAEGLSVFGFSAVLFFLFVFLTFFDSGLLLLDLCCEFFGLVFLS